MSDPAMRRVPVWDVPTRLFHWALVALFVVAVVAGEEHIFPLHIWAGYAILVLLVFRLGWGFVGSRTARFSDFVRGPSAVFQYVSEWLRPGTSKSTIIGHNPAGGWSVIAMLAFVAAQAASGFVLKHGPVEAKGVARFVHHEAITVLVLLVAMHIAAIFIYAIVKREDLVRPMIFGWKKLPESIATPAMAGTLRALVVFLVACVVIGALVWWG